MVHQNPKLIKICSSCGEKKPLSAFLQLTTTEGTTYGNICTDCRKSGLDKSKKEQEESTRGDTGFKIDTKARVAGEIDKKKAKQQTEELYHEEREKKEETSTQKKEQTKHIAAREKEHRSWKNAFISTAIKSKNQMDVSPPDVTQKAEQATIQQTREEAVKTQAVKEEQQLKTIDTSLGSFLPSQTGFQQKYQSIAWQQFKTLLGASAPINRVLDAAAKKNETTKENKKESLTDYIEKTWGPSSRKK